MTQRNIRWVGYSACLGTLLVAGCTATAERPQRDPGVLVNESVEQTREAAVNALTALGFKIKKQEPSYIEGYRPHKVGFFVGSGGETVGVWLQPEGGQTRVLVSTAKSMVGYVGQKDWTRDVLREMQRDRPQE